MAFPWENVGNGGESPDLDLDWPGRYAKQRNGLGRGRLKWQDGWDREELCIPDPKNIDAPGGEWRIAGLLEQDKRWKGSHSRRRQAVRILRKAGYFTRRRWPRTKRGLRQVGNNVVDDLRYTDGPCEGLQAVDPWAIAKKMADCGRRWYVQPRIRSASHELASFVPIPLPVLCNQRHVCPVCAEQRSRTLARAIRQVITADVEAAQKVAFVTLTHRACRGESLADTIDRWRGAWQRMTRGRPGAIWKAIQTGYYYGLEVTRGEGANSRNKGPWWHVHAHMLVVLPVGRAVDTFGAMLGPMWEAASRRAADAVGLLGHGWDPVAGAQKFVKQEIVGKGDARRIEDPEVPDGWIRKETRGKLTKWQEPRAMVQARLDAGDWTGPWCQELDTDDPDLPHVYQAAKYATPIADLHPENLAEFVSAAHGRRWHQGGGMLRGVMKRADELERDGAGMLDDGDRVDLGVNIGRLAPGEAPALDLVAPDLGTERPIGPEKIERVSFRLAGTELAESAAMKLESVGLGRVEVRQGHCWKVVDRNGTPTRVQVPETQLWLRIPTRIVRDRMFETLAELRAAAQPRGSSSGAGPTDGGSSPGSGSAGGSPPTPAVPPPPSEGDAVGSGGDG